MRSPTPSLTALKQQVRSLSLANKRALLRWLQTQIEKEEQARATAAHHAKPGRELIQEQRMGQVVYRQERICCGKSGCKCAAGELHGPYWYGYRREGGKLKSWYVGKILKTEN